MKKVSNDFWSVDWGADEAKGDDKLPSYFVKIPEFDELLKGKYRYIIGRKGTGKTAVLEQIRNIASSRFDASVKSLSLKDFPIQELRNLRDKSFADKAQFVPIWTFLILIELCRLIIEDESIEDYEDVLEIKDFIDRNFQESIAFVSTIKYLATNNNKVSISKDWFGYEHSKGDSVEITGAIHYNKVINILISKIKNIESKCDFYILFDELDEGYTARDSSIRLLLLALLRAIENLHLELKSSPLNFKPVLALRSDIFDNLEDNDLNKLDDYLIRLKWTTEKNTQYSLYNLVNQRINASITVLNPADAWSCVVYDHDPKLPVGIKTLWFYLYNKTFERPRDIVKFLKCCSKLKLTGPLSLENVKSAESTYSNWFYNEFKDEIQSHLPIWREACDAFVKVGKGKLEFKEISDKMLQNSEINLWIENNKKSTVDILEKLFEFGLIGNYNDSQKWIFKYKDHDLPFDHNKSIIVHYGFYRKFKFPQ